MMLMDRNVSTPRTTRCRSSHCEASQVVSYVEHAPQPSTFDLLVLFKAALQQLQLSNNEVLQQPRFIHDASLLTPLISEAPPVMTKAYQR
jgi:hypothetical protein